jgi:MarR family transcriptional regulator, organic hydroperoxide resistance regulator
MLETAENLRLSHQLCFALYAATHAIIRSYRGMLGELGLTYPQYLVLVTLMEHSTMTSGELARALKLDAGTLTPLLKRLAAAGLVSRERRPEDERIVDISLTAEGWALHDGLARTQNEVACRTGLTPEDMAALRASLHDLTDSLACCDRELAELV